MAVMGMFFLFEVSLTVSVKKFYRSDHHIEGKRGTPIRRTLSSFKTFDTFPSIRVNILIYGLVIGDLRLGVFLPKGKHGSFYIILLIGV